MIPGYVTIWLSIIIVILFATGWKPYLAPRLGTLGVIVLGIAVAIAAYTEYWWSPFSESLPTVRIHVIVAVLLAGSLLALANNANKGQRSYLMLCALMLSIIWGSIRSLYTHDPILYWLEPAWNASLFCGLLCPLFTLNIRYQCGALLWGSVLGEIICAWLDHGVYKAAVGSIQWWDSLSIAATAAFGCSLAVYGVKRSAAIMVRTMSRLGKGGE
ncbi:hypothetical protein [Paenibacillus sp. PAMC21692]|uniref:YphA family membrane protein n=1 Tax=Paenibacillus sp. PAMC21692 TaxID=2762320 RepID=UPI00164D4DB8|nr:hypothetical protein [Paenibacillus sp. PAMC21692]QNK55384.1 hypothetical protein H7F31_22575 [Paenibacillus sp. PAMC21692]